jgi:hypothetical protein
MLDLWPAGIILVGLAGAMSVMMMKGRLRLEV